MEDIKGIKRWHFTDVMDTQMERRREAEGGEGREGSM